jgi:nucleoside-diphosphate-sugar epimerase
LILVTGANGFVGSALVAKLAGEGRDVVAGVREMRGTTPQGIRTLALGDLADPRDRESLFNGVSCVVHTAARVHMLDDRARDPMAEFRRVNVAGTITLARQALNAGVRRFVFVSSIKVNGETTFPGRPFLSTDTPQPSDPYGISKLEAEHALVELAATTGLEVVIVRPPLVYGPGVRANFRSLMKLLRTGLPLPFGAIDNRRSLVGIGNLVDLLAACIDAREAINQTFLVSDAEDVSTTALMRRLALALNVRSRLIPVPPRVLTVGGGLVGLSERMRRMCESLQVDISATRRILGWQPRWTLDQELARTAEHFLHEARV